MIPTNNHVVQDPEFLADMKDTSYCPDNMKMRRVGKLRPISVVNNVDYEDKDSFNDMLYTCNTFQTEHGEYKQYTARMVVNYDKGCVRSDPSPVIYVDGETGKRTRVRHTGSAPYEIMSDEITSRWTPDVENMSFTHAVEGVKITVWYHKGWHFSTNRRIDGLKGRWASKKTYGERLTAELEKTISDYEENDEWVREDNNKTALETFTSSLDTDIIYEIIMQHDADERVVCDNLDDNSSLYLVGTYAAGTFVKLDELNHVNRFLKPRFKLTFNTVDEMKSYLTEMDPFSSPGLIGYHTTGYKVKVILDMYMKMFKLRGNQPSIRFRYIQLRGTPDQDNFVRLYSEHVEMFNEIEADILNIKTYILNAYNNRYTMRRYIPREEWNAFIVPCLFSVVKECHYIYKNSQHKCRICFSVVNNLFDSFPAPRINHIIKSWKQYQKDPSAEVAKFEARGVAMRAERNME